MTVAVPAAPPSPARRSSVRRRLVRHGSTALLLLAVAVLVLTVVGGRSSLRLVTVESGSMAPTLPVGSLLVEQQRSVQELAAGDVITFVEPSQQQRVVTHRVVDVDRSQGSTVVQTRGDANPGRDPWTAELLDPHVWVVTAAVPHVGGVLQAAQSPLGWVVVSVLLPGAFAVSVLRAIWRRPDGRPSSPVRRRTPWAGRTGVVASLVLCAAVAGSSVQPASANFTASVGRGHALTALLLRTPATLALQDRCLFNGKAVELTWTPVGTGQTAYSVERQTGTGGAWTVIGTATAPAASYVDRTAGLLTRYSYRVSATRGTWTSPTSNVPTITTTGFC